MRKVLSFDVGIKNLAYCYLEFDDENKKLGKIMQWGIINLRSDLWMPKQNEKKCSVCGKGSNFWIIKDGERSELCKVHLRQYEKKYNEERGKSEANEYNQFPEKLGFEIYPYDLRNLRCLCGEKSRKFFIKIADENEATESINNEIICITKIAGFCNKCAKLYLKKGGSEKLIKVADHQKDDDTKMYGNLYNGLEKIGTKEVEDVIIENQPALKNPRMKSVQMFLYSYYFVGGKDGKFEGLNRVGFFSATKKLNPTSIVEGLLKGKLKLQEGGENMSEYQAYKKRKTDGVEIVKCLLEEMEEWQQYFADHPKKDDLADSLLQGIAHYCMH